MAKTKTPFLSLGSSGTVAGFLTSQRRGRATLLREKPVPTDPFTLPQQYIRWLYEDYVCLWHAQSDAVKAEYRSAGVRFHLTAFQYWMKYHLAALPDIVGWWKMDDNLGATTPDSSRNGNTMLVQGPSPGTGYINGCFSFDGINDRLFRGASSSLDAFDVPFSVEFSMMKVANSPNGWIISKGAYTFTIFCEAIAVGWRHIRLIVQGAYADWILRAINIYHTDIPTHIVLTYDGTTGVAYKDGIFHSQAVKAGRSPLASANCAIGGFDAGGGWYEGWIDNLVIRNRIPSLTDILRWSNRRWPI